MDYLKRIILPLIGILVIIINISMVHGATIHGRIYDPYLERINDVKVSINSQPKQLLIAKDSEYSFEVGKGEYIILAQKIKQGEIVYETRENISLIDSGDYVIDLILFPNFNEEEQILKDSYDIPIFEEESKKDNKLEVLLWVLLGALTSIAIYAYLPARGIKGDKEQPIEEIDIKDKESGGVINILRESGGRTTQKEIRKMIPLSEAKISLIISELESKGILKKIKKGRGNIIVLNRK